MMKKMKQTNADRIRSMTNDELAVFLLTEECKVCSHCKYNGEYGCTDETVCGTYHLEDVWKKWLSSEYEGLSKKRGSYGKRKRKLDKLEYLNSEECKKKCDNIPIYNMILLARFFSKN